MTPSTTDEPETRPLLPEQSRNDVVIDLSPVLGKELLIGDSVMRVIGVLPMQAGGDSGIRDLAVPDRNRHCYLPLSTVQAVYPLPSRASELDLVVLNFADPEVLIQRSRMIQAMLQGLHDGAEDVTISIPCRHLSRHKKRKKCLISSLS